MTQHYRVPSELQHEVLNPREWWTFQDGEIETFALTFYYDAAYYCQLDGFHPWEHKEWIVKQVLLEWKVEKVRLHNLFVERAFKKTTSHMIRSIQLFTMLLFWSNREPVRLDQFFKAGESCSMKPVNLGERLQFVLSRPGVFHAYKQLSELFDELEKKVMISLAQEKANGKSR